MKSPAAPAGRLSDSEAIEARAAAWLAERDDRLSPEGERAFAQWRAADPRHEAAVTRLENAWAALQQLRDFRPEAARHPDCNLLRGRAGHRGRSTVFPAFAATALAASIALAAFWWIGNSHREAPPAEQRYATTVDGYERVALEDGSLLELNATSEVIVEFTPAERRVRLTRGEAHFTVAKNKERPFSVEAGAVAVRAVGTAFNVRLGSRDVEVLVTEGKVEVANAESSAMRPPPVATDSNAADRRSVRSLSVNERALIPIAATGASIPSVVVEKVAAAVVHQALAWQGPRLTFVDTPLSDAVAQFNRRNQVQLVLEDPELESLSIGGSFRAENVDAFVRLLESGADIVVDRSNPFRIILRKAR